MSQPTWLPPLNSHRNYTILVSANQYALLPSSSPPPSTDVPESTLLVKVKVTVDFFSSDTTVQRTMKGLSLSKSFDLIPPRPFDASDLFDQIQAPFPLNEVKWESRRIDGARSRISLHDEDDLVDTLSDFLEDLVTAPCNADRRKLAVSLVIEKTVTLPADEFEAWTAWYDNQAATREGFEREYGEAIARPREERELVEELVFGFRPVPAAISSLEALEEVSYDGGGGDAAGDKEQCSICLEELEVGVRVTRLPCSHQFHGECVVKWLRRSNACPLCRQKLIMDRRRPCTHTLGFELIN